MRTFRFSLPPSYLLSPSQPHRDKDAPILLFLLYQTPTNSRCCDGMAQIL